MCSVPYDSVCGVQGSLCPTDIHSLQRGWLNQLPCSLCFLNPGCLSSPEEVRLGSKGRFQVGLEDKDSPAGEVTSSWEGDTPLPAAESLSRLGTGMGGTDTGVKPRLSLQIA